MSRRRRKIPAKTIRRKLRLSIQPWWRAPLPHLSNAKTMTQFIWKSEIHWRILPLVAVAVSNVKEDQVSFPVLLRQLVSVCVLYVKSALQITFWENLTTWLFSQIRILCMLKTNLFVMDVQKRKMCLNKEFIYALHVITLYVLIALQNSIESGSSVSKNYMNNLIMNELDFLSLLSHL